MDANRSIIRFEGYEITTFSREGQHYVAIKPLAELFGLDWSAQFRRIKRDPVLSSTIAMMATVADDGKDREMVCLPLEFFPGWLFKIDVERIGNPYLKPLIVEFQKKVYGVLYRHFYGSPEKLERERRAWRSRELWLNKELADYAAQEVFRDERTYMLARRVWRLRHAMGYRDMERLGIIRAGRASGLVKKYELYLAKTYNQRAGDMRRLYDDYSPLMLSGVLNMPYGKVLRMLETDEEALESALLGRAVEDFRAAFKREGGAL